MGYTLTIGNNETVVLSPVPRAKLEALNELMLLIQSRWIESGFSTGDVLIAQDSWDLMEKVIHMLPRLDAPGTHGFDMQKIEADYGLIERLFFSQSADVQTEGLSTFVFDLGKLKPCIIYEMHRFEAQKKIREAHELYLGRNSPAPSKPLKSRSKAAA